MYTAAGGRLSAEVKRLVKSLGDLPEPCASPVLVIVSGLPGTGKSYLSARLAEKLEFKILESDALRKQLFSSPVYSAEESTYLFRVIHQLIEYLLKKGVPVILDATNLSESHREHLYNIAERCSSRLVLIEVKAPPELVFSRLEKRSGEEGNKSEADWSIYQRMVPTAEKIRRHHYSVDTSRDISAVIDKIIRDIRRKRK